MPENGYLISNGPQNWQHDGKNITIMRRVLAFLFGKVGREQLIEDALHGAEGGPNKLRDELGTGPGWHHQLAHDELRMPGGDVIDDDPVYGELTLQRAPEPAVAH